MTSKSDSAVCPYCGDLLSKEVTDICPFCKTPHHLSCWAANEGCTTLACLANPYTPGFTHRDLGARTPADTPVVRPAPRIPVEPIVIPPPPAARAGRRTAVFIAGFALIVCAMAIATVRWFGPGKGNLIATPGRSTVVAVSGSGAVSPQVATVHQPTRMSSSSPSSNKATSSTATRLTEGNEANTLAVDQPRGRVNTAKLNVRKGPAVDYDVVEQLGEGIEVELVGRDVSTAWWQIRLGSDILGWVNGKYIDEQGCTECVPYVEAPPTSAPTATSEPTATPLPAPTTASIPTDTPVPQIAAISEIADNRNGFSGNQGENGWKYLMESSRNSGVWREMQFDGNCYRTDNWEKDVRICADGEVHPGQSTRVAYEWRPTFNGSADITVHVHKVDTTCGDGVWVGIFRARDGVGVEAELGSLLIGGGDNTGRTATFSTPINPGNLFYVIIDIHGDSTCDMSRVSIDISAN